MERGHLAFFLGSEDSRGVKLGLRGVGVVFLVPVYYLRKRRRRALYTILAG